MSAKKQVDSPPFEYTALYIIVNNLACLTIS